MIRGVAGPGGARGISLRRDDRKPPEAVAGIGIIGIDVAGEGAFSCSYANDYGAIDG
jgi:hypothetical protein